MSGWLPTPSAVRRSRACSSREDIRQQLALLPAFLALVEEGLL
jgi:hypothetical protein